MSTETFKGARYIPKFYGNWTADIGYEAIGVVKHNAFTYISKQPVPAGVEITNTNFWLLWADPNAQMEELRQIFMQYVGTVNDLSGTVNDLTQDLAAEIQNRESAITAETEAREAADDEINASIAQIRSDYKGFNTISLSSDEFVEIGHLDLPTNHQVQGICYHSSYLYVFHHLNNNSPAFVSKYDVTTNYTLAERLELPYQMHANGMCYDSNTGCIIITDTLTSALHFIDVSGDMRYLNMYQITTGAKLSAFCVTANGSMAYGNLTSSNSYVIYDKHGLGFCALGKTIPDSIGSSGRQDMSDIGNYGYAHLCSIVGGNENVRNIIKTFSQYGTPYVTFTFPDTEDELEGLAYRDDTHMFYIVSLNGILHTLDVSTFMTSNLVNLTEPRYAGNYEPFWILPSTAILKRYQPDNIIETQGRSTIQRYVEFPKIDQYMAIAPVINSYPTGAYMGNATAGGNLRSQNIVSGNANQAILLIVGYNFGTGQRMFLSQILAHDLINNVHISQTFTEGETTESVIAKIEELEAAGIPIRGTNANDKFGPQRFGASFVFEYGFIPFSIVNVDE